MKLILDIPDNLIEPVRDKLAAGPTGVLEAVAVDAILGFLASLAEKQRPPSLN